MMVYFLGNALTVLLVLRSIVSMSSAVFVWLCVMTMIGTPASLFDVLLPAILGGSWGRYLLTFPLDWVFIWLSVVV